MRFLTQIGLVLGLLLLIGLLAWQGFLEILQLLFSSGWYLLLLPLAWLPVLLPATQGWRQLFKPDHLPSFVHALLALWMGRAVNNLLPVASIGGEIVKARLLFIWGTNGIHAAASVMVDKAVQALALAFWGSAGVLLLLFLSDNNELASYAAIGFIILIVCAVGFIIIQQVGLLGILAKAGGKIIKNESWEGVAFSADEVDRVIRELYLNKTKIILATLYRLAALILHTLEVWLACYLLGRPIGIIEALMLRSLTATLSDIAFIIPNAYGIQEGAFIIIGSLIGLDPEFSLAVSLALRVRDLIFDPAGLLTLQQVESQRYYSSR